MAAHADKEAGLTPRHAVQRTNTSNHAQYRFVDGADNATGLDAAAAERVLQAHWAARGR
jgi:hypothetical protein|eukprot:SAG25_NODE_11059_length_314_cov_1.902326_1_plen_59_part_00